MASSDATWHVYLLRCADDTLYCGVTTDLDRRLAQHNGRLAGGARYTRPRRPVALLLSRACTSRQEALRLEYHIKRLPRSRKEQALKEFPQCCPWILSALMLALAPGPDIIFVLTQSALYGMRAGVATTLGLISGLCFHTTIVAVGVAGIFMTSPLAFTLLTVVGAAYLLYLAWLSFRAGASMAHLQESRFLGYWGLYRRGVIMNITNPKVTLFFLAFLPQFCAPERGSVALQVMELGLLFMLAAFLVFTAVSALGGRLAHWFNSSPRGQMLMHRVAGLVFVALAVMLIFSCVA